MQEDKWSTQLGERLRNLQEETPQPYLPGAWEAFEARRNQKRSIPLVWWWTGGIAASLALLLFFGLQGTRENQDQQVVVENQSIQEGAPSQSEQYQGKPELKENEEVPKVLAEQSLEKSNRTGTNPLQTVRKESPRLLERNLGVQKSLVSSAEPSSEKIGETLSLQAQAFASTIQVAPPIANFQEEKSSTPSATTAETYTEIVPAAAEALLAAQKDPLSFSLGLGPGFGSSSEASQVTSGSRIGLGMQVDMALARKLRIGSGLGVNYLNQSSEGPLLAHKAGINSPMERTTEVQQVQVDLPIYLRYSVTPSKSISVQAGFSNLLTFNQEAQQELVYTRQVAAPADATANSLSTLKSVQVVETSPLDGPSTRFFPFALANLGVNVRVYETEKSTYLLMPFYSYPLQDISGTGQNPAVLGAAVKITFGTLKK